MNHHFDCICFLVSKETLKKEKHELAWIKLLKKVTAHIKEWSPCSNDRVCSEHLVDGKPTVENPNPTLKLGYELTQIRPRQTLFREPLTKKPKTLPASSASVQSNNHTTATVSGTAFMSPLPSPSLSCSDFSSPVSEHSYYTRNSPIKCKSCDYKDVLIHLYKKKLEQLKRENRLLKSAKLLKKRKPFSWTLTKTDKKMNFYTGLSSVKLFEVVYNLLLHYIPILLYWRGTKRIISSKVRPRIFILSSQKKLTPKVEFLLTLMRLRVGILNEDLADRFGISTTICSNIRFLAQTQAKLLAWLWKTCQKSSLKLVIQTSG